MRITVEYPPESFAAVERLRRLPNVIPLVLIKSIDQQNEFTVGHIQKTRLSSRGPETLGVRTNRLRSSIRPAKAVQEGHDIVSSIGTNVEYAGVHEYGFDGIIREHQRLVRVTKKMGVPLFTTVRAHARRVKARAPIRRGIEERLTNYAKAMAKAVVDEANRTTGGAA